MKPSFKVEQIHKFANVQVQVVPTKDLNGNADELNIHLNPCLLPPPTSTTYLHVDSVAEVLRGVLEVLTGLVRPTNVLVAAGAVPHS